MRKRLVFLDIARAYACVVMVFGHTFDSLLHPAFKEAYLFKNYQFFRGLTAPTFLFISGFAFFFATNLKWDKFLTISPNLFKRIRRIVYLLFIGYLLHFPYENIFKPFYYLPFERFYNWMNVDILQCIAMVIFIMHVTIFILREKKYFIVFNSVIILIAFFFYKPIWFFFFKHPDTPLSYYFSGYLSSYFPIFPWIGYYSMGTIFSYFYLKTNGKNWERNFFKIAVYIFTISFLIAFYFKEIKYEGYFSDTPFFFLKISLVIMIFSIIGLLVKNLKKSNNLIMTAGSETLTIYWIHLVIVYGSAWNRGLYYYIGKRNPFETLFLFIVVFIFSLTIVLLKNYLKSNILKFFSLINSSFKKTLFGLEK